MTPPQLPLKTHRSGISLLEVLISIGILSIGLLATLALIPAGRYYMKRAAVDDRAAAIVPSAFAALASQGMLGVNASSWQPKYFSSSESALNGETPVYREMTDWVIVSSTSETITQMWIPPPAASSPTISGSLSPPSPGNSLSVTLLVKTATSSRSVSPNVNQTTGVWSWTVYPNPLDAPDMQIQQSGTNIGQVINTPYTDYTFSATYTDGTGPDTATNATPASMRQYGARRQYDTRLGRAQATYRIPNSAVRANESAATATNVSNLVPAFAALSPPDGNRIWRSVSSTIMSASVAQWNTGLREGNYRQTLAFADSVNATASVASTNYPAKTPITSDLGDAWVTGPTIETDVDWYRFEVSRGELITVSWSDPTNALETPTFPVWLNTLDESSPPLSSVPALSGGATATYYINADGFVVTRARIDPNPLPPQQPSKINCVADYSVTFTRYRTGDRAIVIDPLMATRLDKTYPLRDSRRLNFAAFPQTYVPSGMVQPLAIPRLNMETFAALLQANNSDTAIALSELTFHAQDNLAVDPSADPTNEDLAPKPIFDLRYVDDTHKEPARRQSEGKGSWLVMLEPTGPGPVSGNWVPGSTFNASVVIFENRPLPSITATATGTPLVGEYALSAIWDDLDGLLTITIPQEAGLVDEDIRPLFKSGYWLMLAPKIVSDATSATQAFDWVQIQSASLEGSGDGGTVVKLMLVKEPLDTVLNQGLRQYANPVNLSQSQLWALVYEGAVAVVRKTVQLQP